MMMRWAVVSLLAVSTLVLISAGWAQSQNPELDSLTAQAPSAQARVEAFHATLLEAMQVPLYADREALLAEPVLNMFDMPRIASVSLGRTWRSLDDMQKNRFLDLLGTLVVATYADRFDSFSGQSFVTREVREARRGMVVQTELHKSDGDMVSLDYFLTAGKIFNVVADGVSDVSLRRADYNSIIKQHGYEALLTHLEEKIAQARGGA